MITIPVPLTGYISGVENYILRALSGHINGNNEMRSLSAAAMMTMVSAVTIVRFPLWDANSGALAANRKALPVTAYSILRIFLHDKTAVAVVKTQLWVLHIVMTTAFEHVHSESNVIIYVIDQIKSQKLVLLPKYYHMPMCTDNK